MNLDEDLRPETSPPSKDDCLEAGNAYWNALGDDSDENVLDDNSDVLTRGVPPIDVYLRAPCPARIADKNAVFLGFRVSPASYAGYVRIGFATDMGFNVATLDAHHTDFKTLQMGFDRTISKGSARIPLAVPGEFLSRQFRRVAHSIEFIKDESISQILIRDAADKLLMESKLYTPDLLLFFEATRAKLPTIEEGPTRRSLRRREVSVEEQMPASWSRVMDAEQLHRTVSVTQRMDERFDDLKIKLADCHIVHQSQMIDAAEWSCDFMEWPPVMFFTCRDERGNSRTLAAPLLESNAHYMESSLNEDFWVLNQTGSLRIDVPVEARRPLLDRIQHQLATAVARAGNASRRAALQQVEFIFPGESSEWSDVRRENLRRRGAADAARRADSPSETIEQVNLNF